MARGDRLPRLFEMFFIIQTVPGLSAAEIARRCEISKRQCYRDLRTLQDGGVPIYNEPGSGYRLMEGSMLKNISFTLEEALALIYGLKLIEQQKGLIKTPNRVKEKLLALLPKKLSNEIENINERVEIAVTPAVDYSGKEKLFQQLNEAIRNNILLQINYYSFSRDELTSRAVEPYQLVFKDGFWYLVAYCHQRRDTLLFRVDRIRKLVTTDDKFIPPTSFDFEKYMGAAWQMERGEEFTFKVRFLDDAARFIKETTFHPSQQIEEEPDGALIFTARAGGQVSVLRWLLSFGDEAEVLEPPELRKMVIRTMTAGLRRYLGAGREFSEEEKKACSKIMK